MNHNATQDRFLGAVLGLAIGDAIGMPVAGRSRTTIADWYGTITGYQPRVFADGTEVGPGEITDETEIALCIIESFTAARGELDPENIGIRMAYLARSDSRRWMSEGTRAALEGRAEEHDYQLPLIDDELVPGEVAARGIPIGLIHSIGQLDRVALARDAAIVTRITHGSPLAITAVETVALAMSEAARHSAPLSDIRQSLSSTMPDGEVRAAIDRAGSDGSLDKSESAPAVLASALAIAAVAASFEECLQTAVELGGATDSRAAIAGALFAGYHGSSGIPQRFIDDLEARIYVSLAVPWFYRTVARRAGTLIDMRRDGGSQT